MEGTVVPVTCKKCGKDISFRVEGISYGSQMWYIGGEGPLCYECSGFGNKTQFPGNIDLNMWIEKDKCCYQCPKYFICHPIFGKDAKPEGVKNTELKFRIGWRNKDINKRYEWKNDTTVTINGNLDDVENLLKHLKTMKPNTPVDDTWQDWEWTIA